ncbi:hypothetical protein N0V82_005635 [Gnomoniopsis sp. IMI 355080]|nr:hypothetical protein N0V82_005635 [Gnomoniopsis sp. IMI 355080]
MAEAPNIYVSNGTCYTGPGLRADEAMIPCGNVYFQPQSCCQHNDHCLESSVCYNSDHGVTYIAGCTDEGYDASVCPNKFDDAEAPWLGMAYCNDTSNDWVLCDQRGHPGTIVDPDPCACPTATAERSMTLNQAQGIAETASLPDATGLPIGWNTDFYPTIPSALLTSSSLARSSTGDTATPATYPSTTEPTAAAAASKPNSPARTGFNTSAKIGTAIGASAFGIILLALAGFFILRHRRHHHPKQHQQDLHNDAGEKVTSADPDPDPDTIGVAYGSGRYDVSQLSIASPGPSELDNKAARPWSLVSELDNGLDGASCGTAYAGGQGHMAAIMEASHGQNVGRGHGGRVQGEPGPSELEAPRVMVELPA